MSKVTIQGDASGTGIFTIASPNSNTDRTLVLPDEAGTVDLLQRSGNVLQVLQTTKTDTFSVASTTFTDITGLSVSITPTSTSSKILVLIDLSLGPTASSAGLARLVRDSLPLYLGDSAGSRPSSLIQAFTGSSYFTVRSGGIFLDSPASVSSVTYKLQLASTDGSINYMNRTAGDRDTSGYDGRTASSITVMEIAG